MIKNGSVCKIEKKLIIGLKGKPSMKRKLKLFFILIATLLLTSCEKKNKSENALTINICSEPHSLDPRKSRDLNDINVSNMLFDGLFRISFEGKLEPALVESYTISEDKKKYTFKLKDSYWSNNEKLTAYDFEYTYKKNLSLDFASSKSFSLFIIKNAKAAKDGKISVDEVGVKALDNSTLEIQLENICPYFLKLLTQPSFFPVNKKIDLKDPNWAISAKNFVSNGPFKISNWNHNDKIEIVKNENYHDKDKVKLSKIDLIFVSIEVEKNMFETGEIHIAGSPLSFIPVDSIKSMKGDKNFYISPYNGTSFLRINVEKINDKEFRKAILNAIDREKITKHVLQGGQIPTKRLVPNDSLQKNKIEKKDFSNKTLTITYINYDRAHVLMQAVQQDLKDNLNLTVKLNGLEKNVFYEKIRSKDYEVAASSWIADFDDSINFLNVFKYNNSSSNNTGWENIDYISLLEDSETISDEEERKKILLKAEEVLLDEAPIIPICYLSLNYLKRDSLKDVKIYPSGIIDFKYAYLEK